MFVPLLLTGLAARLGYLRLTPSMDWIGSDPALVAAWQQKLGSLWETLAPHLPEQVRDLRALTRGVADASAYADRLAAAMVADPDASQQLLAELDPAERLRQLAGRVQELVDALSPRAAGGRALN